MSETYLEFAERYVMILSAPNGARRSRQDFPGLPETALQLADEAASLLEQQVSVLHLHVRDGQGRHSLDPEHYRQAMTAIRHSVGDELVIQVTSESAGMYTRDEQMDMVKMLRPEAVSLALREICPDDSTELGAGRFYEFLQKERIWPQHILYTAADVARFDRLRQRGVFGEEHPFCLLVLGNYAGEIDGTVEELQQMQAEADFDEFPWSACCFGRNEQETMLQTALLGGHVRIGFENNVLLVDGSLAGTNSQLIQQYLQSGTRTDRLPASAHQVRACFLT